MKLALAQINTTVGDFDGNLSRIREAASRADADLVVFPELSICGYMPRDLLLEPAFLDACERSLAALARDRSLPPVVVGAPLRETGTGKPLRNAAVLVRGGRTESVFKTNLPTYDVFDEHRYFRAAERPPEPIDVGGTRVGLFICEDGWTGPICADLYERDPARALVGSGAELLVNISSSPWETGKPAHRRAIFAGHAERNGVPVALCNHVGANDQLVFDGNSFVLGPDGGVLAHAAAFREDLLVSDLSGTASPPEDEDDLLEAVVLGIRDYFRKTGFADAVVGTSGGIDSSLVACLAVRALGPDHVTALGMPGPYSSDESLTDANELARTLGIRFLAIPIVESFARLERQLSGALGRSDFDETEENLQARLRGIVLMAVANKERRLVLVSSNKSELATGYSTLYGDSAGALAPIGDLYKNQVYALADRFRDVIPARVFEKAPSAELKPDQRDEDSLGSYDVLDRVLRLHLEERCPPDEIRERVGCDAGYVRRVLGMVARAEYKRQQGAPVLKLSPKAFGLGRRFPIVQRFRQGGE